MNQIDVLVISFVLFGGWLGSLRSRATNFISCAGTVSGLALASLYGGSLARLWTGLLQPLSLNNPWSPLWAITASTNSVHWQYVAYNWLEELPWPQSLKRSIFLAWERLTASNDILEWGRAVEQVFWSALTNVCSFLTVMLLVKLAVTLLAKVSLRLATHDQFGARWPGFVVGAVQSAILVFLIVAVAIPFLLLSERTTPLLAPSFTFNLVRRLLDYFIVS